MHTGMISPDEIQHGRPFPWLPLSIFFGSWSIARMCPGLAEPSSRSDRAVACCQKQSVFWTTVY